MSSVEEWWKQLELGKGMSNNACATCKKKLEKKRKLKDENKA